MKKILNTKDILLLALAGIGDLFQEISDPLEITSNAYKQMYGFVPGKYVRRNFYQTVWRSLKTGDIEKVIKNNRQYLRLTAVGKNKIQRDFPLAKFSKKWNRKWVILIFDIEEKSRKLRNILRNKLKNIGFGMLQQSVWITPLPIAGELMDFIDSSKLNDYVFVLEVSAVLLGDPKILARKIWHLDEIEEKKLKLATEKREIGICLKNLDGRPKSGDAQGIEDLKKKQREIKKKELEIIFSLPFLFKELLPDDLGKLL